MPCRFRQISTFGRDTIRRFDGNVSELKKMAARNFDDILQVCHDTILVLILFEITAAPLQCCIPCFEGLFPAPHDDSIQELLFLTATLHALHKLRMHTDTTLDITDHIFEQFADSLRSFESKTCAAFEARELAKEVRARVRRESRKQALTSTRHATTSQPTASPSQHEPAASTATVSTQSRTKQFNLNTYKMHALGDYTGTIRRKGTTDSYPTRIVRLDWRSHWSLILSITLRGRVSIGLQRDASNERTRPISLASLQI